MIKKIVFAAILVAVYIGFFAFVQINHWGVLPLVAGTMFWGWAFYKITGFDLLNISDNQETNKEEDLAD